MPSSSIGVVHREAGAVVGDLEQHAAGLAEVDRVEVVAVDQPASTGRRASRRRSTHFGCSVDAWFPRPRGGRCRRLVPASRRADLVGDRQPPRRSPRSSQHPAPAGTALITSSSTRAAALGVAVVGADALEPVAGPAPAGSPDAPRSAAHRRWTTISSCSSPSGSAKISTSPSRPDSTRTSASRCSQKSMASGDATRHTTRCTIPCAGPAAGGAGVLEEGDVGAGVSVLVGVEQVVDGGIVLVDRSSPPGAGPSTAV